MIGSCNWALQTLVSISQQYIIQYNTIQYKYTNNNFLREDGIRAQFVLGRSELSGIPDRKSLYILRVAPFVVGHQEHAPHPPFNFLDSSTMSTQKTEKDLVEQMT